MQRGAVILREGSGERGEDGERLALAESRPRAARGRSRLTWSARVAWALSRSSSARSSSRRPANARLHTATSDTEPSMLPSRPPARGTVPSPRTANQEGAGAQANQSRLPACSARPSGRGGCWGL